MGTLRHLDAKLFVALAREAALRVSEFNALGIANTVWAFSRLEGLMYAWHLFELGKCSALPSESIKFVALLTESDQRRVLERKLTLLKESEDSAGRYFEEQCSSACLKRNAVMILDHFAS